MNAVTECSGSGELVKESADYKDSETAQADKGMIVKGRHEFAITFKFVKAIANCKIWIDCQRETRVCDYIQVCSRDAKRSPIARSRFASPLDGHEERFRCKSTSAQPVDRLSAAQSHRRTLKH